ncbi:MAG: lipid-A-disaccharide synthase [Candidatus Alcyoniella australis]|nr:lipid-A-disaccharide synthase [Candidatus Alcyoniella australis]
MISHVLQWDQQLFLLLNSRCSNELLDLLFGLLNLVGNGWCAAVLVIPLILLYDPAHGRRRVLAVALCVAIAGLTINLAKPLAGRARPIVEFKQQLNTPIGHDEPVLADWIPWDKKVYKLDPQWIALHAPQYSELAGPALYRFGAGLGRHSSMPSGHTATAWSLLFCLWFIYRRRPIAYLLLGLGAGTARVYLGAHYPSDVIVGGLLAVLIARGMLELTRPLWLGKAPQRPGPLLAVSVGEASADVYAAQLIQRLQQDEPQLKAAGMGGENLVRAGMEQLVDASDLSIVGFTQVLGGAGRIRRALLKLMRLLDQQRPDLLLLIDLPDFNLMLARHARRLGIRVLYFIPPQVWAWRKGRARKVAKRIDRLAVIFPFEAELYSDRGAQVDFVGHPLVQRARPKLGREEFLNKHGFDPQKRLAAIIPGSRGSEINLLLPPMLDAAVELAKDFDDLQFAVSRAPGVAPGRIEAELERSQVEARVITGEVYELMAAADVGLVTSGTVTLEAALCGLPMVIAYMGNWINYSLAKMLVSIDRVGLPNIVARRDLVVELIQSEVTGERLAAEARRFLEDPRLAGQTRQELLTLRESLLGGDVIGRVAAIAREMMNRS